MTADEISVLDVEYAQQVIFAALDFLHAFEAADWDPLRWEREESGQDVAYEKAAVFRQVIDQHQQ